MTFMNTPKSLRLTLCVLLTAAALPPFAHAAPTAPDAKPAKATEQKTYPAQTAVAAKAKFAVVAASDKSVTGALDAKALPQALQLVGHPGAFQGTVTNVHVGHGNGIVILNFAADYHEALTAVVKPADYAKFPALAQLQGKRVLIHGTFSAYHGVPEVDLTAPGQIKIIQ